MNDRGGPSAKSGILPLWTACCCSISTTRSWSTTPPRSPRSRRPRASRGPARRPWWPPIALVEELGERFGVERRARHEVFDDVEAALATLGETHVLGLVTNGDDLGNDVEGAIAAGLDAVWVNRFGQPSRPGIQEVESLTWIARGINNK